MCSASNYDFLVAYPEGMLVRKQPPTYAVKGERVQIDCGVLPGKLLQQYTINWYKSTQMIVASNVPIDNHYALDPSSLSLIINNVTVADTDARYKCELTVRDPQTQQTYNYNDVLERNFITVVVLGMFISIIIVIWIGFKLLCKYFLGLLHSCQVPENKRQIFITHEMRVKFLTMPPNLRPHPQTNTSCGTC